MSIFFKELNHKQKKIIKLVQLKNKVFSMSKNKL